MLNVTKRQIDCPIIRPATKADAIPLVNVIFDSKSTHINSVFSKIEAKARKCLAESYSNNIEGVYVLVEGEEIIGALKLKVLENTKTKSYPLSSLVKHFGFLKGIKSGVLLAMLDEYQPKKNEAFLEFISIKSSWQRSDAFQFLIEKAVKLSIASKKKKLSYIIPRTEKNVSHFIEKRGFEHKKNIFSLAGKIFSSISRWEKFEIPIIARPVSEKSLNNKTENFVAPTHLIQTVTSINYSALILAVPVVNALISIFSELYLESIVWGILSAIHLLGIVLLVNNRNYGSISLICALIIESSLMIFDLFETNNWLMRAYVLPLILINSWIVYVLVRAKQMNYFQRISIFGSEVITHDA